MRRFLLRAMLIFAQFVIAGSFTRAIDTWVVSLDPAWQLAVLAMSQLFIAIAQAYVEGQVLSKAGPSTRLRMIIRDVNTNVRH